MATADKDTILVFRGDMKGNKKKNSATGQISWKLFPFVFLCLKEEKVVGFSKSGDDLPQRSLILKHLQNTREAAKLKHP